jgi:hypothetical protein
MTAPASEQKPLAEQAADQAVAGIDQALQGDQRMAGAEGPLQSHPGGLAAVVQNAPGVGRALGLGQAALAGISDAGAAIGGAAISGATGLGAALPFLQALLRPLILNALRYFAAGLLEQVIRPLEAELASIATNHPDVNLDRCNAAVGHFYDAAPDLTRPAPQPAPAQATPTRSSVPEPIAKPTAPVAEPMAPQPAP